MRTLKLTIAYDGTDFAGWQRQANVRTVQASIEDALTPIEGERVVITGAGRTDAGVHAVGQVASVSLASAISTDELMRALNATLAEDVRITRIENVRSDFNARFDARQKAYRYAMYGGDVMPPRLRRYAWHVPEVRDVEAMRAAAELLLGQYDFSSFQASGGDVKTTVRELIVSEVAPAVSAEAMDFIADSKCLFYNVTGTGFLRHMVRNIVGTLADIGRGRRSVDDMQSILASRDRAQASATAPPHGLTLLRVDY